MKKLILFIVAIGAISVGLYFALSGKKEVVERKELVDTYTAKLQVEGEPIDYKFGKEHKVVKAIVSDQSNSKPIIAKKLVDLIPFNAQAVTIRRMLEQLQDNPAINSEMYEKMEGIVNKYFDEAVMREKIEAALAEEMSREELAEVLAWQETPIAQQANALNEKAMDPDFAEDIAGQMKEFDSDSIPEERKELLRQLDEATGGSKTAIDNMIIVQLEMMKGMTESQGNPIGDEQVAEMEQSMRESLKENLIPQVEIASQILYKDVPAEDIQKNIEVSGSDAVSKYQQVMQKTTQGMLAKFGHEMGSSMTPQEE